MEINDYIPKESLYSSNLSYKIQIIKFKISF